MYRAILLISLVLSFIFGQTTQTYSWEDDGTILGYNGNVSDPQNVSSSSGVTPYDGSQMLSVSESPLSGTPQVFLVFIENLSEGDEVSASFFGWDDTPSGSPSIRIWGGYASNGDINDYQGSAGGNNTYTDGSGWSEISHTWTIPADKEALVIQGRLYSGSQDPTEFFIDLISVTAPDAATINFPSGGGTSSFSANAGDDQFVSPGDFVTLDGSASQGDIIAYIWEQTSGPNVSLSGSETAIVTFTVPEESGIMVFQLTVFNMEGDFSTDDVSVTIISEMTISDARGLGVGHGVVLNGVVISPNFQSSHSEYVIQDETAGLVVFGPGLALDMNYGDNVRVSGITDEYNGKFEVVVSSIEDVENFGPGSLPEAQVITVSELYDDGEEYESELILLENVFLLEGSWPSEGNSVNLVISDNGFDEIVLRIDSDTDIDGSPEPSWPLDVTGVGGQYDYSEPYDGGYQILSRFISDFESTGGNLFPEADAGDDQVVEPGELVTLDGTNSEDPDGEVVGFIWQQEEGPSVSLSDYEDAIVTFTAPSENATLVFTLTAIDNEGAMGIDQVSIVISGGGFSIVDVQYSETPGSGNDCYPSSVAGEQVTVSGIVTGVQPGSHANFYIQEPNTDAWGGVYIYDDSFLPVVGEEVIISANVSEYYGLTELTNLNSYIVNSSGNTIEPLDISTGTLAGGCSLSGEEMEGMLVRISNVTVTQTADEFGQWYVDDGSGPCQIDDTMFNGTMSSVSVGDELNQIIGLVDFSYSEYGVLPRSDSDLGGGGTAPVTIYDIQYTTEQGTYCYETPVAGQVVTISGVVTHVNSIDSPNFFFQDPSGDTWSGIYVFDTSVAPLIGDELELTATVNEYYSFTQLIDVTVSTLISSGNTISPTSLNTNDIGIACSESGEMYESMLVSYSNITFESADEFGNWIINDGSGTALVDDYYFDGTWPTISEGDFFESVTGVIGYSYSEFKLYPRNSEDFVLSSGGCSNSGDVNDDSATDILDVVAIVAYILGTTEFDEDQQCNSDVDDSESTDILDVVAVISWILGSRGEDASSALILKTDTSVSLQSNGFVGAVQMTLSHDAGWLIDLSDNSLIENYRTEGNETILISVVPATGVLFTASGDFDITELIAANSQEYIEVAILNEFKLMPAYPNPFNPITTIPYQLTEDTEISIKVFDMMGREIAELVNGKQSSGYHSLAWDASNQSSGIYFVKLESTDFTQTQRLILIK